MPTPVALSASNIMIHAATFHNAATRSKVKMVEIFTRHTVENPHDHSDPFTLGAGQVSKCFSLYIAHTLNIALKADKW
jgi:hypothetical protein